MLNQKIQNADLLTAKAGGEYSYRCSLEGQIYGLWCHSPQC
jgi:hypothetical protein